MGKKANKATRKFAASGQLKKTIQQRRKHQDIKRKAERRKGGKKGKERARARARAGKGEQCMYRLYAVVVHIGNMVRLCLVFVNVSPIRL